MALHYYYSMYIYSNTEIDLGHMNQSWRQSTSYLSKRALKEVGTKAGSNVVDQHSKSMSCHPLVLVESKHMQSPSKLWDPLPYTIHSQIPHM